MRSHVGLHEGMAIRRRCCRVRDRVSKLLAIDDSFHEVDGASCHIRPDDQAVARKPYALSTFQRQAGSRSETSELGH